MPGNIVVKGHLKKTGVLNDLYSLTTSQPQFSFDLIWATASPPLPPSNDFWAVSYIIYKSIRLTTSKHSQIYCLVYLPLIY